MWIRCICDLITWPWPRKLLAIACFLMPLSIPRPKRLWSLAHASALSITSSFLSVCKMQAPAFPRKKSHYFLVNSCAFSVILEEKFVGAGWDYIFVSTWWKQ